MIVKGRALIRGELLPVKIVLSSKGVIERVEVGTHVKTGEEDVLDFEGNGRIVLPGLIDLHVHLRDWRQSYKETIESGSRACVAGGFTVVGDMPNTDPPVDSYSRALERDSTLSRKSIVDYVFYVKPSEPFREVLKALTLAIGIKVYPEDLKLILDPEDLEELIRRDVLVIFHSEDPACFRESLKHGEERPVECEVKALEKILNLTRRGLRVHITHVTSKKSLELISSSKKSRGSRVTLDVTPHHLYLDNSYYETLGSIVKVYPPLRSSVDVEYLRSKVLSGAVDAVASDHAPHDLREKMKNYSDAPPGIPGVEIAVPLIATLTLKLGFNPLLIVDLMCRGPAKILRLDKILGSIEEGKLASLTVVDFKHVKRVEASKFYSKAKYSPFEGWELKGWPIATIVRSNLVYLEGEVYSGELRGVNVWRMML